MTVTQETAPPSPGTQRPGEQAHTDSATAFVPDQSRAERKTSYDVADFAIPGGREEDWRFTPVDRIGGLFQVEPTDESRLTLDISAPQGVEISEAKAGGQDVRFRPVPGRPRVRCCMGWRREGHVGDQSRTRSSSASR